MANLNDSLAQLMTVDGAMTAAVLECLEPDRHARMAAFAVPWVREHFDAALVSRAFTDYLADVCREHGQVPPAPTVRWWQLPSTKSTSIRNTSVWMPAQPT